MPLIIKIRVKWRVKTTSLAEFVHTNFYLVKMLSNGLSRTYN